jgi:hypothetical protein
MLSSEVSECKPLDGGSAAKPPRNASPVALAVAWGGTDTSASRGDGAGSSIGGGGAGRELCQSPHEKQLNEPWVV